MAPEIALLEEPTRDKQEEEESNIFSRGKEMSLSRSLGSYYKLPKSDPYAVYLVQCCFITANIVWAG